MSAPTAQTPKLLDRLRAALRQRHYPAQAEEAHVAWVKRFIFFHDKRHPATLTAADVMAFLASLATDAERLEARSAILFLYRHVLNRPLDLPDPLQPAVRRADPIAALRDQAREALRVKHYALRTEEAYLDWIKRFIRYHGHRHPRELGGAEVAAFLTHLATEWHADNLLIRRSRLKAQNREHDSHE